MANRRDVYDELSPLGRLLMDELREQYRKLISEIDYSNDNDNGQQPDAFNLSPISLLDGKEYSNLELTVDTKSRRNKKLMRKAEQNMKQILGNKTNNSKLDVDLNANQILENKTNNFVLISNSSIDNEQDLNIESNKKGSEKVPQTNYCGFNRSFGNIRKPVDINANYTLENKSNNLNINIPYKSLKNDDQNVSVSKNNLNVNIPYQSLKDDDQNELVSKNNLNKISFSDKRAQRSTGDILNILNTSQQSKTCKQAQDNKKVSQTFSKEFGCNAIEENQCNNNNTERYNGISQETNLINNSALYESDKQKTKIPSIIKKIREFAYKPKPKKPETAIIAESNKQENKDVTTDEKSPKQYSRKKCIQNNYNTVNKENTGNSLHDRDILNTAENTQDVNRKSHMMTNELQDLIMEETQLSKLLSDLEVPAKENTNVHSTSLFNRSISEITNKTRTSSSNKSVPNIVLNDSHTSFTFNRSRSEDNNTSNIGQNDRKAKQFTDDLGKPKQFTDDLELTFKDDEIINHQSMNSLQFQTGKDDMDDNITLKNIDIKKLEAQAAVVLSIFKKNFEAQNSEIVNQQPKNLFQTTVTENSTSLLNLFRSDIHDTSVNLFQTEKDNMEDNISKNVRSDGKQLELLPKEYSEDNNTSIFNQSSSEVYKNETREILTNNETVKKINQNADKEYDNVIDFCLLDNEIIYSSPMDLFSAENVNIQDNITLEKLETVDTENKQAEAPVVLDILNTNFKVESIIPNIDCEMLNDLENFDEYPPFFNPCKQLNISTMNPLNENFEIFSPQSINPSQQINKSFDGNESIILNKRGKKNNPKKQVLIDLTADKTSRSKENSDIVNDVSEYMNSFHSDKSFSADKSIILNKRKKKKMVPKMQNFIDLTTNETSRLNKSSDAVLETNRSSKNNEHFKFVNEYICTKHEEKALDPKICNIIAEDTTKNSLITNNETLQCKKVCEKTEYNEYNNAGVKHQIRENTIDMMKINENAEKSDVHNGKCTSETVSVNVSHGRILEKTNGFNNRCEREQSFDNLMTDAGFTQISQNEEQHKNIFSNDDFENIEDWFMHLPDQYSQIKKILRFDTSTSENKSAENDIHEFHGRLNSAIIAQGELIPNEKTIDKNSFKKSLNNFDQIFLSQPLNSTEENQEIMNEVFIGNTTRTDIDCIFDHQYSKAVIKQCEKKDVIDNFKLPKLPKKKNNAEITARMDSDMQLLINDIRNPHIGDKRLVKNISNLADEVPKEKFITPPSTVEKCTDKKKSSIKKNKPKQPKIIQHKTYTMEIDKTKPQPQPKKVQTKITNIFKLVEKSKSHIVNDKNDNKPEKNCTKSRKRKITDIFPVTKSKKKANETHIKDDKSPNSSASSDKEMQGPKFNKRKQKFFTPIWTQLEERNIQYKIYTLDDNMAEQLKKYLTENKPSEINFNIIYKEGFCLLSMPKRTGNVFYKPIGIMLCISWTTGKLHKSTFTEFYYLSLSNWTNIAIPRLLLQTCLTCDCRKICFKVQTLFILLMNSFSFTYSDVSLQWIVLDPFIGCWLFDPDHPPSSFQGVQTQLDMIPKYKISSSDVQIKACDLLIQLSGTMQTVQKLLQAKHLWDIFSEMEMKIVTILSVMEHHGVSVNINVLNELGHHLKNKLDIIEKKAYEIAGRKFQLNSTVQLRKILYDDLKLDTKHSITIKETTVLGAKSTSEPMLQVLRKFHPLPGLVLEYRHLHKAKSTFVDSIIQHIKNGVIYASWEQTAAATGRIASNSPNLQAIPKQPYSLVLFPENGDISSEETLQLRSPYNARPGYSLLAADFQQIELRVFAHLSQDKAIIKALNAPGDIFMTLTQCWQGTLSPITTKENRETTKRIVYATMYGAGPGKLADILSVSIEEAIDVLNDFSSKFPSLHEFSRNTIARCRNQGYLTSLSGRRRLFPDINNPVYGIKAHAERQAVNFCIQGSAADICKAAMISTEQHLQGLNCQLLLQIHDELVWEVQDSQLEQVKAIIKNVMEDTNTMCGKFIELSVPLPVSISSGKNWGNMS